MKFKKVREGKIKFWIPTKKEVFYNPVAELNRDISVCAVQIFQKDSKLKLDICDALSATGISGLRYAKEVSNIKKVVLNDKNPMAVKLIKKNIKENRLSGKCTANKEDANVLLHENVFLAIDIDPFGSPNIFLDSAARSIWHKGFLCVTATDTAPLAGTYPLTCLKKYGIISLKTPFYNELGMRILISYIILTFAKRDRVFIPQLCFTTKHYFRVFGKIEHLGKMRNVLKKFGYLMNCKCGNIETGELKEKCYCGKSFGIISPIYLGKIFDKKFCEKVLQEIKKRKFKLQKQEEKMLKLIVEEADMPIFYYNLHYLGKVTKKEVPKIEILIKKLKKKGFKASRTHFCPVSIRTNANLKKLLSSF